MKNSTTRGFKLEGQKMNRLILVDRERKKKKKEIYTYI